VAVGGVLGLVANGPVRAEDRIEKRLWVQVKPGGSVVVDSFREMREDCTLAPAPKVTVPVQPKLGKMKVTTVTAPGSTDQSGPYAACNGKKFNWTRVSLPTPAKGEGTDHAVVEATESSGETTLYDIDIVYAKKLPAGKSNGLYEDR
jgi:hypothetical protein